MKINNRSVLVVAPLEQDIYLSRIAGLALSIENQAAYSKIRLGDRLIAQERQVFTAGAGGNLALAFSKWGFAVTLMSPLGGDGVGWQIGLDLDKNNIDRSLIQMSNSTATNYRLYDRGTTKQAAISCEADWSNFSLNQFDSSFYDFAWAYVGSTGANFKFYDELFHKLKLAGRKILFNPSEVELANLSKCYGLLEDVDILLVNRAEAELLTQDKTLAGAAKKLSNFVDLAVITGAEDGVIVSSAQSVWRAGVYQKVASLDRNGVGDAFGAGFLAKYMTSGDVTEAIVFASANASSVIGKIGATTGLIDFDTSLDNIQVRETAIS